MHLIKYDWGIETGFMIPNSVLILPQHMFGTTQ